MTKDGRVGSAPTGRLVVLGLCVAAAVAETEICAAFRYIRLEIEDTARCNAQLSLGEFRLFDAVQMLNLTGKADASSFTVTNEFEYVVDGNEGTCSDTSPPQDTSTCSGTFWKTVTNELDDLTDGPLGERPDGGTPPLIRFRHWLEVKDTIE